MTTDEHEPQPIATSMLISQCSVCSEKVRKLPDGSWEHFGEDQPYETITI
jgi:hypothetical protein